MGRQLKEASHAATMLEAKGVSVLEMYCCTVLCEKKATRSSSRKGAAKQSQQDRFGEGQASN